MMADIQHTQTHPKFTSSDKIDGQKPLDLIQSVKKSAMYHWENLLPACGIDIPAKGKHGSCPICRGGTDRFHFIDDHHNGNWHCRQCDIPNYGDGLDLVAKTQGISILEAAKVVADALALPLPESKPAKETIHIQPIAEKVAVLMAQTVAGESSYLTAKGLYCSNQRLLEDSSLLLPLITLDKRVTGAQIIKPDGAKKLLSGSQKKSAFIALSDMEEHPGTV
ncbi:primase-helicase zinc-binding domain-containing protein [Xenorhabdus sp. SGI240]|uniref:primase-helicase zinc-binding domain-containing protein n=1 Tax=Xenorhabdus sp. SGI240 TaxID=3158262 RepID=UPI0032B791A9